MKNKIIALLLACFCLSSCFGGKSPSSSFYTLDFGRNISALSNKKFNLFIDNVDVPDYLKQPQIVTIEPNRVEISRSEFNRWGAPLRDLIQRNLAENLNRYFPKAQIMLSEANFSKDNYLTLRVDLNRLEGTWEQKAILDAEWAILDAKGREIVHERSSFSTPLGNTYEELVQKQSLLLSRLAEQIAQKLVRIK